MSLATADAFMSIFGFKRVKPGICAICTAEFKQQRMGQKTCSDPVCRAEWKRQVGLRKQALAEKRAQREKLKTRQEHAKEAQQAFNAWIRWRDRDEPCISCGATKAAQWDASHYRSVGAAPELRFDEANVHKACSVCNQHKSGNIIEYRLRLIHKIGAEELARLEGPHGPKKYSIEELKEIKAEYKRKVREPRDGS